MLLLSVEPETLCHIHVRHDFGTLAVLVPLLPHAVVSTAVGPHIDAEAVLLIELVLALVATPIAPLVEALTVHLTVDPVAFVARLSVRMDQLALAVEHVVLELTFIDGAVDARLPPLEALLTLVVHAFISLPVQRLFEALPVRAVVQELAFVAQLNLLFSVLSLQLALAAGKAVQEDTFDDGAGLDEGLGAVAVRFTRDEATLVLITVGPLDLAHAIRQPLLLILACIYAHLARVD